MATGIVKFFKEENGYGFITPKQGGKDVFVHVSKVTEPITKDDEVEFDVEEGKKGPEAVNVRRMVNA